MSASPTVSAATEPGSPAAVSAECVGKIYGKQQVLSGVSFQVRKGEIFAFLGPNGAGKTTLMKIIVGLAKPTFGKVKIFGHDCLLEKQAVKKLIAFVPQENNLEREFTVEQALVTYGRIYGVRGLNSRLEEVMEEFRLHDMRKKDINHLSGGMARRVLIARAMLTKPQLLLMDEPTVGLDPDIRWDMWNMISALAGRGCTIILTTHYMEEAERLCGRVALLRQGELLTADTPAEIVKRAAGSASGHNISLETAFIRLLGGASQ